MPTLLVNAAEAGAGAAGVGVWSARPLIASITTDAATARRNLMAAP